MYIFIGSHGRSGLSFLSSQSSVPDFKNLTGAFV